MRTSCTNLDADFNKKVTPECQNMEKEQKQQKCVWNPEITKVAPRLHIRHSY